MPVWFLDLETESHIISAVIFQIMPNWDEIEPMTKKELPAIILLYILKTSLNINCSCTYNYPGGFIYDPLGIPKVLHIRNVIFDRIKQKNYEIFDMNNNSHILQERFVYHETERFSRDELFTFLSTSASKPTLKQLTEEINKQERDSKSENYVAPSLVKYYIEKYDLRDMIQMKKRRTKAEMQKQ